MTNTVCACYEAHVSRLDERTGDLVSADDKNLNL
jgi:hypothetical protein